MPLPRRSLALADAPPPARPAPAPARCAGLAEEDAHAWLDGELDADAAHGVTAHLRACPGCRAHVAALAAFLAAVRRDAPGRGVEAPERLRALVRTLRRPRG